MVLTTSNSWREQLGQAIKLMPRERMRNDFKISKPTLISCTGSAASDTRSVSPMPSASSIPKPTADLTEPERIPPASVIPKCSGWSISLASKRYAPTAKNTSDALTDTLN